MIVDDVLEAGLWKWFAFLRVVPQIFRVPFRVAPVWRDGALEYQVDPLAVKLCPTGPVTGEPGRRFRAFDATWGRKPYPALIIASERQEGGVLVVYSHPDDRAVNQIDPTSQDRWHFLWCFKGPRGFVPIYGGFATHDFASGALTGPAMETQAHSDNLHQVTRNAWKAFGLGELPGEGPSLDSWEGPVISGQLVALTLFSLLNARNVTTEPVSPPAKLNRARVRNGKAPLMTYHVLRVAPLRALRQGAPASTSGASLPLHWVRGHFKVFTAERPLFGRLAGRFWWQPMLHGRDRSRRVEKDYLVQEPPDA